MLISKMRWLQLKSQQLFSLQYHGCHRTVKKTSIQRTKLRIINHRWVISLIGIILKAKRKSNLYSKITLRDPHQIGELKEASIIKTINLLIKLYRAVKHFSRTAQNKLIIIMCIKRLIKRFSRTVLRHESLSHLINSSQIRRI